MELTRGLLTGILLLAPTVTTLALLAICGRALEESRPRLTFLLGSVVSQLVSLLALLLLTSLSLI